MLIAWSRLKGLVTGQVSRNKSGTNTQSKTFGESKSNCTIKTIYRNGLQVPRTKTNFGIFCFCNCSQGFQGRIKKRLGVIEQITQLTLRGQKGDSNPLWKRYMVREKLQLHFCVRSIQFALVGYVCFMHLSMCFCIYTST